MALAHTWTYSHEQIGLLMINSVASYMYSGISIAKNACKRICSTGEGILKFNQLTMSFIAVANNTLPQEQKCSSNKKCTSLLHNEMKHRKKWKLAYEK
jgi:hypothetical protein